MNRAFKFRVWWPDEQSYDENSPFNFTAPGGYFGDIVCGSNGVIEQFTGLYDKNGKEIYEGDLLEVCGNKNGLLTVEFKNAYVGGWVLTHPSTPDWVSLGARNKNDIEIIGNIHETPEAIK